MTEAKATTNRNVYTPYGERSKETKKIEDGVVSSLLHLTRKGLISWKKRVSLPDRGGITYHATVQQMSFIMTCIVADYQQGQALNAYTLLIRLGDDSSIVEWDSDANVLADGERCQMLGDEVFSRDPWSYKAYMASKYRAIQKTLDEVVADAREEDDQS